MVRQPGITFPKKTDNHPSSLSNTNGSDSAHISPLCWDDAGFGLLGRFCAFCQSCYDFCVQLPIVSGRTYFLIALYLSLSTVFVRDPDPWREGYVIDSFLLSAVSYQFLVFVLITIYYKKRSFSEV